MAFSSRSRSERSRRRVLRLETTASQVNTPEPARKKSGPTISFEGPWAARLIPRYVTRIRTQSAAAPAGSQGRKTPMMKMTMTLPAK